MFVPRPLSLPLLGDSVFDSRLQSNAVTRVGFSFA